MRSTNSRFQFVSLGFFFLLLCIVGLLTIRSWLPLFGIDAPFDKKITHVSLNKIDFKHSDTVKTYNYPALNQEDVTVIKFRFKASELKDYMDLFQTAPLNTGIRLEMNKQGGIALVSNNKKSNDYLAFQIEQKILPQEWHDIEIIAWKNHYIKVIFDKLPAAPVLQTEFWNKQIDYKLSQIKVGEGFSPDRKFVGEIKNFELTSKVIDLKYRAKIKRYLNYFIGLLGLIAIGCLLFIGKVSLNRQTKIELFSTIVLLGFVSAVIFHYIAGFYLEWESAKDTFIAFFKGGYFSDFYITLLQNYFFDPYHFSLLRGEYFPFTYLFLAPLSHLNQNVSLVIFYVIVIVGIVFFSKRYFALPTTNFAEKVSHFKNVFILSFLSYPFLFSFERGNLEFLLFLLVGLSLFFYEKKCRILCGLCLALPVAMKLYPAIFVILFLSDRRYKEVVVTMLFTVFLTVISLFFLKHSFSQNATDVLVGLKGLSNNCAINPAKCLNFSSGLLAPFKLVSENYFYPDISPVLLMKKYISIAFVGLCVLVSYVLFIEVHYWRKLALLVFGMLLFPMVSFDYKLLYILLPIAAFVNNQAESNDFLYLIMLGMLLIPKHYYWLESWDGVSVSSLINPLIMLFMVACVMQQGLSLKFRKVKFQFKLKEEAK